MSKSTTERLRTWSIPIGIIVIAGLLITLIVLQVRNGSGSEASGADPATSDQEQPDLTFVEARDDSDVQSAGPVEAPVGLVVYSDYQCPFCAKWTQDTLPVMMQYAEMGDLRIEWRDVNQYGPDSERASLAAHAAGKQDMFWEYHALLFPDGEHLQPGELTEESLVTRAEGLGMDAEQFAADLNSEESLAVIQRYAAEGKELGVSGTPTFVLGGEPIVGAQPESVFVDTLLQALADAR